MAGELGIFLREIKMSRPEYCRAREGGKKGEVALGLIKFLGTYRRGDAAFILSSNPRWEVTGDPGKRGEGGRKG